MPEVKPTTVASENPQTYEDVHVHAVYDEIAPHFSSTRYKPWPIIAAFLSSLPTGSVGVDLGTGNGKYLPLPSDRPGAVWTIGLDRSINLLKLAKRAGDVDREVVWGDVLDNPWRRGAFDYAISIATIHHLATPERRKVAVQRVLEAICPSHGRALIYVWAIEQDELSKRNIPTDADEDRRHTASTDQAKGQDVFVPWVLAQPAEAKPKTRRREKSGQARTPEPAEAGAEAQQAPPKVFNRYYHMFAKGELCELVADAAKELGLTLGDTSSGDVRETGQSSKEHGVQIVQDGWERSNYYVELRRWER
ncbi:S-adenosyl-L-methionine-dependent methyltransferase [Lentinus tigrinus ALCF2SS1-7]|uniref:S-adenosyl-L-methionine-dependent methyltransferase n=1 Tax=Lentinus tigrinus ALCF2SS1-6 TaxID=1328759 RepID=A0A5C2SS61_9APHY|nr:S-adenosyl-L-methionine-dependent methyltransferase [Lentinus tigrinus ALCF2SS1-6]RPD80138.1 S-adenosyl-L-methionine-dependent methyltransferase [Lentinus tigrinus ALCF2SS1-7]